MQKHIIKLALLLTSQFLLFSLYQNACGQTENQNWEQWRGPNRDGILSIQLPQSLQDEALTEVWSKPLSPSYSGPLVVGDLVYITETVDSKFETVLSRLQMEAGFVRRRLTQMASCLLPGYAMSLFVLTQKVAKKFGRLIFLLKLNRRYRVLVSSVRRLSMATMSMFKLAVRSLNLRPRMVRSSGKASKTVAAWAGVRFHRQ